LYFKAGISESNGRAVTLGNTERWGQVPPGMVFVPKEKWPQNQIVSGTVPTQTESYTNSEIYDFAIDKYEASVVGKTPNTVVNLNSIYSATFPNSRTFVLQSVPDLPDLPDYGTWYQFKQGCLNRTYDSIYSGFVAADDLSAANSKIVPTTNPQRKFRLPNNIEWFVAANGSPEIGGTDYCNVDNRAAPANPSFTDSTSTQLCKSKFGAQNMVGNMSEYTDHILLNGKHGACQSDFGTGIQRSLVGNISGDNLGSTGLPKVNTSTSGATWNFRKGFYTESSASDIPNSFSAVLQSTTAVEGGSGGYPGWVSAMGGYYGNSPGTAGRFRLTLTSSPIHQKCYNWSPLRHFRSSATANHSPICE
jgi:hypothetical protein